jgi:hypothetical protein
MILGGDLCVVLLVNQQPTALTDQGGAGFDESRPHEMEGLGACGSTRLLGTKRIVGRVTSWRQQPGMLGLRYGFLQEPLRGWLEDGTLDWLWDAAEHAGIPIAMLAFVRQIYDAFGPQRLFWGTDITKDAVFLAAVRDDVHRGAAVAVRAG